MNNSFAAAHPELVCEWSEKNLPLMPDKITYGSNKIVWWKANCGHEWQTSVKSRSAGEKCPICSGARVVEGINDLATLKPELARQWSKKNKLKPTQVSLGSHKKVIWKCKHGHEWEASVKSRAVNGTGCPYCSHIEGMGGYSIYASSLDGSDPCVRLEAYMADEHGGKDGWKIERCYMKDPESREMVDIIFGQFFVCYAPAESEKFLSLPKELAQKYEARFKFPERFFKQGNEIKAVPYKPKTRGQER